MLTVWLVEALNTFLNDLFKHFRNKETLQRKGEQFNVSCMVSHKWILGYKSLLRFDIVVNPLMSGLGHMGKSLSHQPPQDTANRERERERVRWGHMLNALFIRKIVKPKNFYMHHQHSLICDNPNWCFTQKKSIVLHKATVFIFTLKYQLSVSKSFWWYTEL